MTYIQVSICESPCYMHTLNIEDIYPSKPTLGYLRDRHYARVSDIIYQEMASGNILCCMPHNHSVYNIN